MAFLTMRELRSSTEKLDTIIKKDGKAVITNNGKPAYIMLGVDEYSLEDTLIELRILEGKRAVAAVQQRAKDNGLDELTLDDINAEIKAIRKAR